MSTFTDILNTPVDQVEAPKPAPEGSYICIVDGPHTEGTSKQKQTPFVEFNLKILSAGEDVDPDAFAEAKAQGKALKATFYLTADSIFRLKDFLIQNLEIEATTFPQMLSEAPGRQVIAFVKHEVTNPTDGTEPRIRTRVDRFAKV